MGLLATVRRWVGRSPTIDEPPVEKPAAEPKREFTYENFRRELEPRIERLRENVPDPDLLRDCCKGIMDARLGKPRVEWWSYPRDAEEFVDPILRSLDAADRELAAEDVARLEREVRERLGCS